jgi:ubiquinone biosynthesis protein
MTLEGIGKQLDPELDVLGEAQPFFLKIIKERYSPQRLGNDLIRGVEQLSRAGYDVPIQAREVLEDLRLGRLVIKTADPGLPGAADRLGRRMFSGVVVASMTVSGALLTPHQLVGGLALFAIAALMGTLHVVRDRRLSRATPPK